MVTTGTKSSLTSTDLDRFQTCKTFNKIICNADVVSMSIENNMRNIAFCICEHKGADQLCVTARLISAFYLFPLHR